MSSGGEGRVGGAALEHKQDGGLSADARQPGEAARRLDSLLGYAFRSRVVIFIEIVLPRAVFVQRFGKDVWFKLKAKGQGGEEHAGGSQSMAVYAR